MSLEQRVEDLEIKYSRLEVVIRGTHDAVILILKEQNRLERKINDLQQELTDFKQEVRERFDQLERTTNERFDKLERLIVSALAQKS